MKKLRCENCGSHDLVKKGDYWVCTYCDSRFEIDPSNEESDSDNKSNTIQINVTFSDDASPVRNELPPKSPGETAAAVFSFLVILFTLVVMMKV